MGELGFTVSFEPFDMLENLIKLYSVNKLSEVERLRIDNQLQEYRVWIENQQLSNERNRAAIRNQMDAGNMAMGKLLDDFIKNTESPEKLDIYKELFISLLNSNLVLSDKISEMKITG